MNVLAIDVLLKFIIFYNLGSVVLGKKKYKVNLVDTAGQVNTRFFRSQLHRK